MLPVRFFASKTIRMIPILPADQGQPYRLFGTFRLFLAFMVFFSHAHLLLLPKSISIQLGKIGIGNIAVVIFFTLSGYIISEAADIFYEKKPFFFLLNRFLRIFPPYVGALLLSFLVHLYLHRSELLEGGLVFRGYSETPSGLFSTGTLLYNLMAIIPIPNRSGVFQYMPFPFSDYPFVGYAWSIKVEVVFYLIVFVVLWVMCKTTRYKKKAILFIIACMLGAHLFTEYVAGDPGLAIMQFTPYFLLGVIFYYRDKLDRSLRIVVTIALMTLIFLQFSRFTQGRVSIGSLWFSRIGSWDILVPTLMVLGLALLVDVLARVRFQSNLKRVDQWLGDLSYPVFLNHSIVVVAISATAPISQGLNLLLLGPIAFLAVFVVSWAMKVIIEAPMLDIRAKIRGRTL